MFPSYPLGLYPRRACVLPTAATPSTCIYATHPIYVHSCSPRAVSAGKYPHSPIRVKLGVQCVPDSTPPRICIHFFSCPLLLSPQVPLLSSARLLELTHVHMVLVALRVSRVPVSFSVSLTFFSHGFQIYGHRARTFLSSFLAFGSCMHLLSRLKLSFLFLLAAHSCTLLFSTGFSFSLSSSSFVCIFIIVPSFLFPGGT